MAPRGALGFGGKHRVDMPHRCGHRLRRVRRPMPTGEVAGGGAVVRFFAQGAEGRADARRVGLAFQQQAGVNRLTGMITSRFRNDRR